MRNTDSKALKNVSSIRKNNEKESTSDNQNVLKSCCKAVLNRYKIRRVTNKGAVLVLILSFMATCLLYLLISVNYNNIVPNCNNYNSKYNDHILLLSVLSYLVSTSIAGLLADTFIGRYKVIRCSVWMMWIFMILATVSVIANCTVVDTYYHNHIIMETILTVTLSVAGIGLGGFQANIIQFGLDQLHDASTTEITSFTIWYTGTITSAGIVNFIMSCLNDYYKLFAYFFVCLGLTVAVLIITCCNHHFVKEPPTKNPFKLIFKVVKFAIKNKRPQSRSAFTYCEDDLPSRIDFGKSKYGGPFTTEEVEDVKTFLRMLPIITTFALVICVLILNYHLDDTLSIKLFGLHDGVQYKSSSQFKLIGSLSKCYTEESLTTNSSFVVPLLIVLNETLLYPVFHRYKICLPRIKSLSLVIIGIFLQTLRIVSLMVFDVLSRQLYLNQNGHNATIHCILNEKSVILQNLLSPHWLVIPHYLYHFSILFGIVGIIQFVASQSPYSMRGLLLGILYIMIFVLSIPFLVLLILFKEILIWGTKTISCEFWFLLIVIIITLAAGIALVYLTKRYKMRKREDLLPNEHYFAERYYSQ